jgi:hypothetical protein
MNDIYRLLLAVLTLMISIHTMPAKAQNGPGFKTPSNNIFCIIVRPENDPISYLRCDIVRFNSPIPEKPGGCDLDWGDAFLIAQNGDVGIRICHGDTAKDNDMSILSYGRMWRQGAFTCKSQLDGLTCTNPKGHGFLLSRSLQRLF